MQRLPDRPRPFPSPSFFVLLFAAAALGPLFSGAAAEVREGIRASSTGTERRGGSCESFNGRARPPGFSLVQSAPPMLAKAAFREKRAEQVARVNVSTPSAEHRPGIQPSWQQALHAAGSGPASVSLVAAAHNVSEMSESLRTLSATIAASARMQASGLMQALAHMFAPTMLEAPGAATRGIPGPVKETSFLQSAVEHLTASARTAPIHTLLLLFIAVALGCLPGILLIINSRRQGRQREADAAREPFAPMLAERQQEAKQSRRLRENHSAADGAFMGFKTPPANRPRDFGS